MELMMDSNLKRKLRFLMFPSGTGTRTRFSTGSISSIISPIETKTYIMIWEWSHPYALQESPKTGSTRWIHRFSDTYSRAGAISNSLCQPTLWINNGSIRWRLGFFICATAKKDTKRKHQATISIASSEWFRKSLFKLHRKLSWK